MSYRVLNSNFQWFCFVLWCAILLSSIIYSSFGKIKSFDPNGQLIKVTMDTHFEKAFTKNLARLIGDTSNTIIHFTADHCTCHIMVASHIEQLNILADKQNYTKKVINLTAIDNNFSIPSVPAVAVYSGKELSYLGPYSTGLYCSTSDGLVRKFLDEKTNVGSLGATIISDAQGCYCPVN